MEWNAQVLGDGGRFQVRVEVRGFVKKLRGEVLSCAVLK